MGLVPVYDELAMLVALPKDRFEAMYPEFRRKATAANPLANLLPTIDKVVAAQARNRVQLALFEAAIAVLRGGPEKRREVPDPFGKGAFEYHPLAKGFELKSAYVHRGWPLTITVGPEAMRPATPGVAGPKCGAPPLRRLNTSCQIEAGEQGFSAGGEQAFALAAAERVAEAD